MTYNRGDIIKVQFWNIAPHGAYARLDGRTFGFLHYSEVPCSYGEVIDNIDSDTEYEVMVLGPGKPDKRGNPGINLSKRKTDDLKRRQQVATDIQELEGEEKSIRDIWKIFTQINKLLLMYMKQPILLQRDSAKLHISEKKLVVKANTESKFDLFQKSFTQRFNTQLIPRGKNSWIFYAKVDSISERTLQSFKEECDCLFMDFFPQPVVEGKIWNFHIDNRDEIEKQLIECFPNIIVSSHLRGELVFRQSYNSHAQGKDVHLGLNEIITEIRNGCVIEDENTGESIEYKPIPLDFEVQPFEESDKFIIERNIFGQQEHESIVVGTLRGETFACDGIEIGKLKNVNYPSLTFTIEERNLKNVQSLIEQGKLNKVATDLTGDSEKVNRLQESFDYITESFEQLKNPALASYLFDASKASPNDESKINKRIAIIQQNLLNSNLNEWQIKAIAKAVEAKDLSVIQGPPGTGKSTAIAELIWQLALANPKNKTLLTSEANLAVDNALDRLKYSEHNLVKPIRIGAGDRFSSEGLPYAITEMMKWAGIDFSNNRVLLEDNIAIEESEEYRLFDKKNVALQRWMANITNRAQIKDPYLLDLWTTYLLNLPEDQRKRVYYLYKNNCNVIGATCSSITEKNYQAIEAGRDRIESRFMKRYNSVFPDDKHINFDVVVQDEASKATPSELSMPLVYGYKSVIIGDHRQLPPNLDREDILYKLHYQGLQSTDIEEKEKIIELEHFVRHNFDQLEKSHFERLFMQADDSIKGTFKKQYRMHPAINRVIEQFYTKDGGLECGLVDPIDLGIDDHDFIRNKASRYHGININGLVTPEQHVVWIDTNSPEIAEGTSRMNKGEVDAIDWVLSQLANSDSFKEYNNKFTSEEDKEIGLISFYGAQLKNLKLLQANYSSKLTIKPSSVDRFQGMERNIVIVSLVRSNTIAQSPNQRPNYFQYPGIGYMRQTKLGFAESPNRLNVALSRAKRLLIIVGNSEHFSSYINKEGNAIYKNVFESIKQNPDGRIINWKTDTKETKLPKRKSLVALIPKFRSVNLNTRDINEQADKHLRIEETWLTPSCSNPRFAVLELSTKAVKLMIGLDDNKIKNSFPFDFSLFDKKSDPTETGKGINAENEMNMNYFKHRVLTSIFKMRGIMRRNGINKVYTVATAAYRTAKNRDEIIECIRKATGINVKILSKREESISTMYAYGLTSKCRNVMLNSSHTIMIEQGGGSTEVSIFNKGEYVDSYSVNFGTTSARNMLIQGLASHATIKEALARCDQMVKDRMVAMMKNIGDKLQSDSESFCVSVGTAITNATGKSKNALQHDCILNYEQIKSKIEATTDRILSEFSLVSDFEKWEMQDGKSKSLDTAVTMRLGLPLYLYFMDHFNIKEIHVSGTGLWYGIYLQHLHNIADN